MDALRGSLQLLRHHRHLSLAVVARFEQMPVSFGQSADAAWQRCLSIGDVALGKLSETVDQQKFGFIGESQPVSCLRSSQRRHLKPGHAAGPVKKAPRRVIRIKPSPHRHGGLLKHIVSIGQVANQRVDISKQSGAALIQQPSELRSLDFS